MNIINLINFAKQCKCIDRQNIGINHLVQTKHEIDCDLNIIVKQKMDEWETYFNLNDNDKESLEIIINDWRKHREKASREMMTGINDHTRYNAVDGLPKTIGQYGLWFFFNSLIANFTALKQIKERSKLRAFISYSKYDGEECRDPDLGGRKNYLKLFKEKLSGLTDHKGILETWDDTKLIPGEDWDARIVKELNESDIIFLLVSSSFAATKYIIDKELKIAFDRHLKQECIVVPIIVRKYDGWYDIDWIPTLSALPRKGHSIDTWKANPDCHSEDEMWSEVYKGVKSTIETFLGSLE